MKLINIGFSIHRPEMVPLTGEIMAEHDLIILEEPPSPDFDSMLNGTLGVDEYLLPLDMEYPDFSRRMCYLERELYDKGKQLIQIEPFYEALLAIHEFLAQGNKPEDLKHDTMPYYVYLAERNATGALLQYYKTASAGSFETTVEAVRTFARADAARFRLRDSLRAQEIVRQTGGHTSVFVEAGIIHCLLWQQLRHKLSDAFKVRPVFLHRMALQHPTPHQHLYNPGDQLTLAYIFKPRLANEKWESLLAARAVIYSKIIQKEESNEDIKNFFHLTDEMNCIQMVRSLSFENCSRLYPLIRRTRTAAARDIVADYVKRAEI